MSTLAEQFHDSFDGYYAGKKSGWTVQKSAQRPQQPSDKKPDQKQQEERAREEAASRH